MVEIVSRRKTRPREEERRWNLTKGDLILVVNDRSDPPYLYLGRFDRIEQNRLGREVKLVDRSTTHCSKLADKLIFEYPSYTVFPLLLGTSQVPTIRKNIKENYEGPFGINIKQIKDLITGPEAIAAALRQINPLYEFYASAIEDMEPPYQL